MFTKILAIMLSGILCLTITLVGKRIFFNKRHGMELLIIMCIFVSTMAQVIADNWAHNELAVPTTKTQRIIRSQMLTAVSVTKNTSGILSPSGTKIQNAREYQLTFKCGDTGEFERLECFDTRMAKEVPLWPQESGELQLVTVEVTCVPAEGVPYWKTLFGFLDPKCTDLQGLQEYLVVPIGSVMAEGKVLTGK